MRSNKKILTLFLIPLVLLSLLLITNLLVATDFVGNYEGFYLFKDKRTGRYMFADHLFVGREKELVYAVNLRNSSLRMVNRLFPHHREGVDHLHVEWNPKDGNGFVSSYFANGTGLVTYLGRYLDDGEEVHGLFVGGGLPETVEANISYNMNNSGMTYYNGSRWFHIWCSVNEGVVVHDTSEAITPSKWEFLGSRIEERSEKKVVLTSSHRIRVQGQPLRIDRRMSFTAGEPYFILQVDITNTGNDTVGFSYLYGDEPWVGYYGTSLGDVGWTADGLVGYESFVDTGKHNYFGMADLGNRLIGEKPVYTNLANFIEWRPELRPDTAYFTNDLKRFPKAGDRLPLESTERFLGVLWEYFLKPSQTVTASLAVGMAGSNQATGLPQKPPVNWK